MSYLLPFPALNSRHIRTFRRTWTETNLTNQDETDSLLPSSSRQHPTYGTHPAYNPNNPSNPHSYNAHSSHNHLFSSTHPYDPSNPQHSHNSHDLHNNPIVIAAAELHRLRIQAITIEDICADTADKLIDLSEGFGRSKIDSDFERLFSEVFEGGLLTGREDEEDGDGYGDGNGQGEGRDGKVKVKGKAEEDSAIANAKDEEEWFRAIIKAARKAQQQGQTQSQQSQQQEKSASSANSNDMDIEGLALDEVVEISRPLVYEFDEQEEDGEEGRLLE